MEVSHKVALTAEGKDPLLYHCCLHIIVLQNNIFLECLNGVVLVGANLLSQQYLHTQCALKVCKSGIRSQYIN